MLSTMLSRQVNENAANHILCLKVIILYMLYGKWPAFLYTFHLPPLCSGSVGILTYQH
jgi:hypothetical protein